ncbi:hypothetical protein K503DRAFT_694954, partial [Rhizopogon vinicolor AM-OR11-026]
ISNLYARPKRIASSMAHSTDDTDRELIDIHGDIPRLHEAAHNHIMTKIERSVTTRRPYDIFHQQIASVIIEWLLDLSRIRLGMNMDKFDVAQ